MHKKLFRKNVENAFDMSRGIGTYDRCPDRGYARERAQVDTYKTLLTELGKQFSTC